MEEGLGTSFAGGLWDQMTPEQIAALTGPGVPFQSDPLTAGVVKMAAAPGQALQSTPENPVTTEQMIKPAADIALATLAPLGGTGPEAGTVLTAGRARRALPSKSLADAAADAAVPPPPMGHNQPPEPMPIETPQAPYLYHTSTADNLAGIGSAGLNKGTFFATEAPPHVGNVEIQQQFPTFRTIQSDNFKPEGNRGPLHPDFISTAQISPKTLEILQGDKWVPFGQSTIPAPTGGRAAAITSYNLRDTPLPQAIEIARQEQHIIPQKDGGYVGAPNNVRSPEDLQRMRASFDEAVKQGASVGGEKWYETGRNVIKEIAPNNPQQQATTAQALGLFSAQATPETNLGFMLRAHNAYEGGEPVALSRTTAQADKYNTARDTGTDIPLGKKTFIYGENLDPNKPWTTTGTNDIWHARAFDYRDAAGDPWNSALTPQQHAFLDGETVLAVDRANKAKLGGRTDWTAPEIQAAGWVGRKGQGQVEAAAAKGKDTNIAEELATASKGYGDALEKHTAYGTSEATPGVGTGHLPAVAEGSQALRDEYAADPRSTYSPGGYDVYHGAMGFLRRPTLKTTGIYEGPKGTEVNPGEASRSLMDIDPGEMGGERTWSPVSKRMITAAEAAKGYVGAQNMSAASMLFTKNKPGRMGSLAFDTGGQWSPEQINAIKAIGSKYGIPDPVHLGDKAYLTNFEKATEGMSPGTVKTMGDELSQALGRPVNPQRAEVASTATFHGPEFAKGYGSGAATAQLREVLQAGPNYIQKLDASQEVRQQVLGQLQRDQEYAARTNSPLRQDLQNARQIIFNEGFAGLFKALDAGKIALPALAGLMALLPGLTRQQPQPQQGM